MIEFPRDFKEFLQLLNSKKIEYLETCFENRLIADLGTFKVNFISKDDLLTNKRASGRPQDLVDFDKLQNKA
jgi:hypothetical protein